RRVARELRPNDQDGARGVPDHVIRNAAQDEALDPVPTAGADDDHVGRLGLGCLDDRRARLAFPDEEGHADADATPLDHDRLRRYLPGGTALVHARDWSACQWRR